MNKPEMDVVRKIYHDDYQMRIDVGPESDVGTMIQITQHHDGKEVARITFSKESADLLVEAITKCAEELAWTQTK